MGKETNSGFLTQNIINLGPVRGKKVPHKKKLDKNIRNFWR